MIVFAPCGGRVNNFGMLSPRCGPKNPVRLRRDLRHQHLHPETLKMALHHAGVEAKVRGQRGLVETVGKNWVLSNLLATHAGKAANYGWYDSRAPSHSKPGGHGPHPLWQPLGLAHDQAHVDYSQILRLVHRTCVLDGELRDIVDVMRDPTLASLVSDEGVMRLFRLPGVSPDAHVMV